MPGTDEHGTPEQQAPRSGFSLSFLDRTVGGDGPAADDATAAGGGGVAFVLQSLIGAGGQGDVWEAWQPSLQRVVAVKILRGGSAERFAREALLTGELEHPAIVPVLEFGALVGGDGTPGSMAMAMKRLRGTRWDELIAREREATPPGEYLVRHLGILEVVCRAGAFAHSRGVLHLDLKPGQVIVGEYGEVYLCDWGMAARMGGGGLQFVAAPSGPFGTPAFMAPEQALGDLDAVGVATDVYLLGATLYCVLTGRGPHDGNPLATVARNAFAPLPDGVPRALRAVVDGAMASNPADRFATAESFRQAVAAAAAEVLQAGEAARLTEAGRLRLEADAVSYDELSAIEQMLDRAAALAPGDAAIAALRDLALERHATAAIARGDLALAAVLAGRMAAPPNRAAVLMRVQAARESLARAERQRVVARRAATATLAALVVVLLSSSGLLFHFYRDSQRELARSAIQSAAAHVESQHPAAARESLRQMPHAWRAWEWGHLAAAAMPEAQLLAPRTARFHAIAATRDGRWIAALRTGDMAMLWYSRAGGPSREIVGEPWSCLAPHGDRRIVAGTADGAVLILGEGDPPRRAAVSQQAITHVAGLPAGEGALAADAAGDVWEVDAAASPRRVLSAGEAVTLLAASGHGVIIGSEGGRLWHGATTAALVPGAVIHSAPVAGIAWRPAHAEFISWAVQPGVQQPMEDQRLMHHRVGQAAPLHVLTPGGYAVTAAAWSLDGDRAMVGFSSAWLHEFDPRDWRITRSASHPAGIPRSVAFAPTSGQILTLTDRQIEAREPEWLGVTWAQQADSRRIAGHAWHGDRLVTAGPDGGIAEWRFDRREHERTLALYPDRITSMHLAADVPTLATAHRWGWVKLWDVSQPTPRPIGEHWFDGDVRVVRQSHDASVLMVAMEDGTIHLLEPGTNPPALGQWMAGGPITTADLSSDGTTFAAALKDGGYVQIDTARNTSVTLRHGDQITALTFGVWHAILAIGDATGTVEVLGPEYKRWEAHTGPVRSISHDPANRLMLTTSDDETAALWRDSGFGDPALRARFRGTHAGAVMIGAQSPDGRRVFTAGADSRLHIFDTATGLELVALPGHQYGILDLALSPDGRRVYTTGQDHQLRTWLSLPWNAGDACLEAPADSPRHPD